MIHVAHNAVLDVYGEMSAHAYFYPGSSIHYYATPSIEIAGTMYVHGSLEFKNPNEQEVTLIEPAAVTFDSSSMTSMECKSFEIQTNAEMIIMNSSTYFNLSTTAITVDGEFSAYALNIANLKEFTVGYHGDVQFDPFYSDLYLGENIDIRGHVALGKHLSIVRPCNDFLLDTGSLTWPQTSDIIVIDCDRVDINTDFSPGIVSTGSGIEQFSVGSAGIFTVTADGPFRANTVAVSGEMYVENLVTFESSLSHDNRIEHMVVHSPNGRLEINSANTPAQNANIQSNQSCSILKVKSLTVDRTFIANDIDIAEGIDDVTVNMYGSWTFGPCAAFHMLDLYTNGTITSKYPLTLAGFGQNKVREIYIEYGGSVTLDSLVQSSKEWSGTSIFGVHDFKMYGKFLAGNLNNVVANEGWDQLDIFVNGTFYFQPSGDFILENLYVNGRFESYSTISMMGGDQYLVVRLGSSGYMKFDSLISSDWTESSSVIAELIETEYGSYWQSGITNWNVTQATFSGQLYSKPNSVVAIDFLTVGSGGNFVISCNAFMLGSGLNVNGGGTMNLAYQYEPDYSLGYPYSKLIYKTVDVDGTLNAASLLIDHNDDQFCENVYISGIVDVSNGGYMYDDGQGTIFTTTDIHVLCYKFNVTKPRKIALDQSTGKSVFELTSE